MQNIKRLSHMAGCREEDF